MRAVRHTPLFGVLAAVVIVAAAIVAPAAPSSAQSGDGCPPPSELEVPGAEFSQSRCLDDLTTLSNEFRTTGGGTRQNPVLHSASTDFPSEPVPGVQIEGWMPDSCDRYEVETTTFMPSCTGGFRHNGQFVIRVPADWDGVHLVVTGAPGVRDQYASDTIVSDWVLSKGWAYASHDRGNTGLNFFRAGDDETGGSLTQWIPNESIRQWSDFMRDVAVAAEGVLAQAYGGAPSLTYAAGASNGGYQVRIALEQHPDIYDGGIDWEGTLFEESDTNLFDTIPALLREYPAVRAGDRGEAYRRFIHDGLVPPDSEPVWDQHYTIYWSPVASAYRPAIDPEYTEYIASVRTPVLPGDPDAQYDWGPRPQTIKDRFAADIANTGEINGRPLITVHGTLDALLPIANDSDRYAEMVRDTGNGGNHRYWVVEGGTHVDELADDNPTVFRPLLPCFLAAVDALDAWVVDDVAPPPSGFVPFPTGATIEETANTCTPPQPIQRVEGADRVATAVAGSRGAFGVTETVVLAAAGDYPDALVAGPLAASLDAPILLVGGTVTPELATELKRLAAFEAIIVGGTDAVPESVDADLEERGISVRRLAGADRFATAAAVASEVGGGSGTAVVASGRAFPDALSAVPMAVAEGAPLLLVEPRAVPAATVKALNDLGIDRTILAGGTAAVSDEVAADLPDPRRIAGSDRYETSVALAEAVLDSDRDVRQVAIADGRNFPDALAAGPVMAIGFGGASGGGPVLLVDGADADNSPASLSLLRAERDRIESAVVVGGPSAVSSRTVDRVTAALTR